MNIFDYSSAKLICPSCGHIYLYQEGTYEDMERYAEIISNVRTPHRCAMSERERNQHLESIKTKMKKVRAEQPGLSFTEQQKIYSQLLAEYRLNAL